MHFARPRLSLLLAPFLLIVALAAFPALASAAPVNNALPEIETLTPAVSDAVYGSDGDWTGEDSLSYEWLLCAAADVNDCDVVSNESSYEPSAEDVGMKLRLRVTASDGGDPEETTSATSTPTNRIVWAPGIIDNSIVQLGIRALGSLNVDDGPQSHTDGTNVVGIRQLDGAYDGTAPGCPCEGWGAADADAEISGWANASDGDNNVEVDSFEYDDTSASSKVTIKDGEDEPFMTVEHAYAPSAASPFLYEATVTVTPLQLQGISDLRYRRTIDWDIEPTPYAEVVTTLPGDSPNVKYVSDDGFASSNPLGSRSSILFEGAGYNSGPDDHGVLFDLGFGAVPYGQTKTFKIYYGVAPTRAQMLVALHDADVETFSLGQNSTPEGYETGAPATFAIGFADVGGSPIVDLETPQAKITSGPAGAIGPGDATFTFTADSGATTECRFDEGPWTACTSPKSYGNQEIDSQHTFNVRALKDGKTQLIPDGRSFEVLEHPLDLYFDTRPRFSTSSTDASFSFYSDEFSSSTVTFTCSLDGAAFAPCDNEGVEFSELASGSHTFVVHGERFAATENLSYTWKISDELDTQITSHPNEFSDDDDSYLDWEGSDAAESFECKLDDGDWAACDNHVELDNFDDGTYTYSVRAVDGDDAVDATPATWTWTIDTVSPVVTVGTPPDPITTDPYTVNISADEPLSKIRCQIDDEPTFTCTSGLTLSGLTFGEHWVWVWAYDRAGNQSDDVGVHINWAGVPAVKPPAKTDPVPPAKPTVSKPGKPKGGKFKVPYTCADATCKLNVSIKLGKKTQKLKGVTVKKGSGKSSFTFSKATKKWLGKKGKKKATLTVTITGSSGSAKTSLTF